jgi:hypothetical protein
MPSTRARVWVTSLTLAAVVMTSSGVPRPSQISGVCCPSCGGRPATDRCRRPLFRADAGVVHARAGPVEFAGRVQLGEQGAVQLVEDSGLPPAVQAPPAGLSRAESQLQRQELPGHAVVEDVQDALQTQPVRYRPWARRLLWPGWQQRLDQRPQVVVHDPWPGAHILPNGGIVTSVTPDQGTTTRSSHELVGHGLIPQRSSA